jgi:hypothetical protein
MRSFPTSTVRPLKVRVYVSSLLLLKYEMNLHRIPSSVRLSVLENTQANRACY